MLNKLNMKSNKQKELIIGRHVSFKSPDYLKTSITEATKYGGNTFMIYTGAPQSTQRKIFQTDQLEEFQQALDASPFQAENLVVHAPYIVNLGNEANSEFGVRFLKSEIKRCQQLNIRYLVLHPGNHLKNPMETGLKIIAKNLDLVLDNNEDVIICLETMAGKGTETCSKFSQLNYLLTNCKYKEKLAVCFDTCHTFDAGYDLKDNLDLVMNEFEQEVGWKHVKVIHLNDSKFGLLSHKDRHENVGYGFLGFDPLHQFIHRQEIANIPIILETPLIKTANHYDLHKQEIEMLKTGNYIAN